MWVGNRSAINGRVEKIGSISGGGSFGPLHGIALRAFLLSGINKSINRDRNNAYLKNNPTVKRRLVAISVLISR
jgi:hypothetical protein